MRGLPVLLAATLLVVLSPAAQADGHCIGTPDHWWPGDDHALDVTGGEHATLYGAGYAAGRHASAFDFPGNSRAAVPDSAHWTGQEFSAVFWVNFDALGGSHGESFIGQSEGGGSTSKWWFYLDGGNLGLHVNSPVLGGSFTTLNALSPTLGTWYQLGFVADNGFARAYVNGVGGPSVAIPNLPDVAAPLQFGQQEGIADLDGRMDDITYWHHALDAGEMEELYVNDQNALCAGSIEPVPELPTVMLAAAGAAVIGLALLARRR